jgi:hypothetical protein
VPELDQMLDKLLGTCDGIALHQVAVKRSNGAIDQDERDVVPREKTHPSAFLGFEDVFTPALRDSSRFGETFVRWSDRLRTRGALGVIEEVLDSAG